MGGQLITYQNSIFKNCQPISDLFSTTDNVNSDDACNEQKCFHLLFMVKMWNKIFKQCYTVYAVHLVVILIWDFAILALITKFNVYQHYL